MPQKHDKGVQKALRRREFNPWKTSINGQVLAVQLVQRGLASREILEGYSSRRKDHDA